MNNNRNKNGLLKFFKKYGYHTLAFVLVVGVTLAIVFSAISNTPEEEPIPAGNKPLVFALPVEAPEVLKSFSSTELFYNATLNQWESHKGIDLKSASNNVYSIYSGTVTNIASSYENGTMITISHEQGFVSVYMSLDSSVEVAVGDSVAKGALIGTMSTKAANEALDGDHLHFELFKDGEKVDPSNYISFENK